MQRTKFQGFICGKCNRPVMQPHCCIVSPSTQRVPSWCPFDCNCQADFRRAPMTKVRRFTSANKPRVAIAADTKEAIW